MLAYKGATELLAATGMRDRSEVVTNFSESPLALPVAVETVFAGDDSHTLEMSMSGLCLVGNAILNIHPTL